MTRTTIVIAAALAFAVTLPAVSAQAQSPRTFISAAGSDSNPCSFAAPCRHFQAAVNATSAGGEVDALDPAGYSPITINQAITIEGQGWSYIAPPAGGNAITINAVTGNVYIRGVSLNGAGVTGGTTGIVFHSGSSLTVRDSVIRNFTGSGIGFAPNSSANIAVSNTLVANNGGHGIYVQPSGQNVSVTAMFNKVEADYNGIMGIGIFNNVTTGVQSTAYATAVDCVTSHNLDTGYYVVGSNNVGAFFEVFRSTSLLDTTGVRAETNGTAIVSQSDLTDLTSWSNTGTGNVFSYGDNNTGGNNAPDGLFTKK